MGSAKATQARAGQGVPSAARRPLEVLGDMVKLLLRPFRTFGVICEKPLSLWPFFLAVLMTSAFSVVSVGYLRWRGAQVLADPQSYLPLRDLLPQLRESLAFDYGQIVASLAVAPVISISVMSIVMFIAFSFTKMSITFKQSIVLTSYAWTPMVLASVINTVLIFLLPLERSMANAAIWDLVIPPVWHGTDLFLLIRAVDPFFLWALFLLAAGANSIQKKKNPGWYIFVYVIFVLPIFFGLMG